MVQFNFTFQPGVTLQQMIGFQIAGKIWSQYLTDNVTVNLHVATSSTLGVNRIGGSLPGIVANQSYGTFYNQLSAKRTSIDDYAAVAGLQGGNAFGAYFNYQQDGRIQQVLTNSETLNLTRANAKALGLLPGSNALDGYILVSNVPSLSVTWAYDYQRTNSTAPANTLDFLSTALHEIGHNLGFVSGVDRPGWVNSVMAPGQSSQAYVDSVRDRIKNTTPLDLLRFDPSVPLTSSLNNASYGGEKYFSLVSGTNQLARFSTGSDSSLGGDGRQGSHWKEETTSLGILDPALSVQEKATINVLDLQAFDVIGWSTQSTTINYATLTSQAKQELAQRLGKTATWLDINPILAVQQLGQDRTPDVNTLIDNSVIYGGGRATGRSLSPQELAQLFTQEAILETLNESNTSLESKAIAPTSDNDILRGTPDSDSLTGLAGADRLVGLAGSDRLNGGSGRDVLYGGDQQDLLVGGKGRDVLVGGAGNDLFVLALHTGLDVVRDFTDGQDKLVLPKGIGFKQLHLEQRGSDILISLDANPLMLLRNGNANRITAADVV